MTTSTTVHREISRRLNLFARNSWTLTPRKATVTWLLIMVAVGSLPGCGGKTKKASSTGPKEVVADGLPKLAEYLKPPIDVGRLNVAPPSGWHVQTSMTGSLARFSRFDVKSARLPSIHVLAEDSPFQDFPNVPKERLADFADAMVDLVKERQSGNKLLEELKPMIIGGRPCVRYVKPALFKFQVPVPKKVNGEMQVLVTLINDRMYTVELRVLDTAQLTKFRDSAYAVFAGLKPASDDSGNPEVETKSEKQAAESPKNE